MDAVERNTLLEQCALLCDELANQIESRPDIAAAEVNAFERGQIQGAELCARMIRLLKTPQEA